MGDVIRLVDRRSPSAIRPPAPPKPDLSRTETRDLWRMMWTHRQPRDEREQRLLKTAEEEWDLRLDLFEKEHGAGSSASMDAQRAAYLLGREEEHALSGEDMGIAKRLYEALTGLASDAARQAMRSLTLRERMRLERR